MKEKAAALGERISSVSFVYIIFECVLVSDLFYLFLRKMAFTQLFTASTPIWIGHLKIVRLCR